MKSEKTCPTCGKVFMSHGNRKFCSDFCYKESLRKKKKTMKSERKNNFFNIKNPIGTIQNIEIRYTVHIEHNEPMYLEGSYTKRNPQFELIHDELLWFNQGLKVGNLDLKIIKERNCKVSDILLFNGYELEDPKQFDRDFKKAMKVLGLC